MVSENDFFRNGGDTLRTHDNLMAAYMRKVYAYMGVGLFLSGITSFFVSQSVALMHNIFSSKLNFFLVMFLPLVLITFLFARINSLSNFEARFWFFVFSIIEGFSFSPIFYKFTRESIYSVFFITSVVFLIMSTYGYFTNRDLTKLGGICFFCLIGVIISELVNLFFVNSMVFLITSIVSVFVFVGFIAYDTKNIKMLYKSGLNSEKSAVIGALALYLDFINLFFSLLSLFGKRK